MLKNKIAWFALLMFGGISCQKMVEQVPIYVVSAYPNPFNEVVSITYNNGVLNQVHVRLKSGAGEIIFEEPQFAIGNTVQLLMRPHPDGIYFLEFSNGNEFISQPIIKASPE